MLIKCAHTEIVDIDLLVPNPRNPNQHPETQIKLLAKILKHQGWRSPIVVSNRSGFITKGHGRLEAAKLNGWTEVPVDRQDYKSEADEYADMVADNKISELSHTDINQVVDTVKDQFEDLDLDLLGIPNLNLNLIDLSDTFLEDEEKQESSTKKYLLEILFPNEMEMMDIHDDLTSRGYIVKIK